MIGVCYTKDSPTAIHLADAAYDGFSQRYDCIKITKDNCIKQLGKCKFLIQVCYPNLYHYKVDRSATYGKKAHQFRNYLLDHGYLDKSIYLETGFINSQVAYDIGRCGHGDQAHSPEEMDKLSYAVGVGGLKGQASYANSACDTSRLEALNLTLLPYSGYKPKFVLIIGQAYRGISSWDIDIRKWYKDTALKIKRHTNLPIVYRPHPKTVLNERQWILEKGFLRDNHNLFEWSRFVNIQDASAVVTYSSNASIDALLLGVPVIAISQRNIAFPIVSNGIHSLGDHDGPPFPPASTLKQFLADLAYAQWTPAELRTTQVVDRWLKIIDGHVHASPCHAQYTA